MVWCMELTSCGHIWSFPTCLKLAKKCLHNWGYGSIILKIVLWAHFTITHAVLRESTDFLKTTYSGTGYSLFLIRHKISDFQTPQPNRVKCVKSTPKTLEIMMQCTFLLHFLTFSEMIESRFNFGSFLKFPSTSSATQSSSTQSV